mgnify:CR=1 FL=1
MKLIKKMTCVFFALLMVITMIAVPTLAAGTAQAKTSVPTKVRVYPQSYNNSAISFDYANAGDKIANLKTNSKNLVARQTYHRTEVGTSSDENAAEIGLYAKKAGKYTVSFDIYSEDGSVKRSSHKITVFAKADAPVSTIKLDGKDLSEYAYTMINKKSAKLSVKMASGYKLQKIVVRTYDKDGKYVEKTVKNNKKITLGKYPYSYAYGYKSDYSNYRYNYWRKYLNAPTYIEITYKDKWTKQSETTTYMVSRLAD